MLMTLIPQEQDETNTNTRVWLIPVVTVIAVGLNAIAAIFDAQSGQGGAPTLLDPAGYAFGIWGVIFIANLAFAGYQALPSQRDDDVLDRAATPFIAGQVFAALFAVAALVGSDLMGQLTTLLYFAAAVATYAILGVGIRDDGWGRRLAAWLPASMSAAWLFAASIVALAGFSVNELQLRPPFGDAEGWAAATVGFAALVAVAMLMWRRDFVFAAVVAWALVAVGQEQTNQVVDNAVVASVTIIGFVALGTVPKATVPWPWRMRREQRARTQHGSEGV